MQIVDRLHWYVKTGDTVRMYMLILGTALVYVSTVYIFWM